MTHSLGHRVPDTTYYNDPSKLGKGGDCSPLFFLHFCHLVDERHGVKAFAAIEKT